MAALATIPGAPVGSSALPIVGILGVLDAATKQYEAKDAAGNPDLAHQQEAVRSVYTALMGVNREELTSDGVGVLEGYRTSLQAKATALALTDIDCSKISPFVTAPRLAAAAASGGAGSSGYGLYVPPPPPSWLRWAGEEVVSWGASGANTAAWAARASAGAAIGALGAAYDYVTGGGEGSYRGGVYNKGDAAVPERPPAATAAEAPVPDAYEKIPTGFVVRVPDLKPGQEVQIRGGLPGQEETIIMYHGSSQELDTISWKRGHALTQKPDGTWTLEGLILPPGAEFKFCLAAKDVLGDPVAWQKGSGNLTAVEMVGKASVEIIIEIPNPLAVQAAVV